MNQPAKEHLDSAERMFRHARAELATGHTDNAVDLLKSTQRNMERAIKALETSADVVPLQKAARS